MSMQDPIGDMFTRIRNAHTMRKTGVSMPHSKQKEAIARLLCSEGFIESVDVRKDDAGKNFLDLRLKYFRNKPVIERLQRVSKPSCRVYRSADDLPRVMVVLGLRLSLPLKG